MNKEKKMAQINITIDTLANSLAVNVDGNNVANVYNVSVYKRDGSPYYSEDSEDLPKMDVCLSTYNKNDSGGVISQSITYAKASETSDDVKITNDIADDPIRTALAKKLLS